MTVKTLGISNKMLLVLCLVAMIFTGLARAEGYDLTYDDPEGDVEDWDGVTYKKGHEHIDIIEIISSENILGNQLVLEMTVSGVITDSENITYSFYLMDGDKWVYMVNYCNGVCLGMDMEDLEEDVLVASGSGTDTLEVRVQMSDFGDVSEFDFWSETYEYGEEYENSFWDYAPDSRPGWDDGDYYEMPVMITEPKPGATVSGIKTITGVTSNDYDMDFVEIQFDSQSDGGWILTSSSGNWETWSYEWQSTNLPDGEHTLNARAYDGTEYYFDSITVYVNQSNAVSPRSTDVPTLDIGYELCYAIDMSSYYDDPLFEDIDMTIEAEMIMKVDKKEDIEVNGTVYEAYAIDMNMTVSMDMTMTYEDETISMSTCVTGEGTQWIRVSDLATIKEVMDMETSYSYLGITSTSSQQSTTIYEPPIDSYNFPMSIAETWTSTSTVTTETTTTDFGTSDSDTESSESVMSFEALHVEEVTVPAGTYETFVIWSMEDSEEYSGGEMPFFGSGPGYSLEYYAPDIGFPVKLESYTPDRNLSFTLELVSYGKAEQDPKESSGPFGWEIPLYFLLIPILAAIILASVILAYRKGKKAGMRETALRYGGGTELTNQPPQPLAPVSRGYPAQTTQVYEGQTPQAYLPPPPPPSVQQLKTIPPQPSQPYVSAQPRIQQLSPPPQKPYRPPPPVSPSVQIKCPNCSKIFPVPMGTMSVKCPFCKTSGRTP